MNKLPKVLWMDGDVVAREAYDAVMAGEAVIINGRLNNFIAWLARILPQRLMRGLMARNQRNAKAKA
jgi:short-subunit dehydrogenase